MREVWHFFDPIGRQADNTLWMVLSKQGGRAWCSVEPLVQTLVLSLLGHVTLRKEIPSFRGPVFSELLEDTCDSIVN